MKNSLSLSLSLVSISGALQLGAQPSDTSSAARARAVVMRHMDAIGGLEAYSAVQSMHMVATMRLPLGAGDMRIETWTTKPLLVYMKTTSEFTTAEVGFDGKVAWMRSNEEGTKLVTRIEPGPGAFDPYEALVRYEPTYVGQRERGGKKMEALQLVDVTGQTNTLYFDAETGLFSRLDVGNPSSPASSMSFDQYKRFETLLYATRITTRLPDVMEPVFARVLSVDHKPIDPKRYEVPKEVRALAERKP